MVQGKGQPTVGNWPPGSNEGAVPRRDLADTDQSPEAEPAPAQALTDPLPPLRTQTRQATQPTQPITIQGIVIRDGTVSLARYPRDTRARRFFLTDRSR